MHGASSVTCCETICQKDPAGHFLDYPAKRQICCVDSAESFSHAPWCPNHLGQLSQENHGLSNCCSQEGHGHLTFMAIFKTCPYNNTKSQTLVPSHFSLFAVWPTGQGVHQWHSHSVCCVFCVQQLRRLLKPPLHLDHVPNRQFLGTEPLKGSTAGTIEAGAQNSAQRNAKSATYSR